MTSPVHSHKPRPWLSLAMFLGAAACVGAMALANLILQPDEPQTGFDGIGRVLMLLFIFGLPTIILSYASLLIGIHAARWRWWAWFWVAPLLALHTWVTLGSAVRIIAGHTNVQTALLTIPLWIMFAVAILVIWLTWRKPKT